MNLSIYVQIHTYIFISDITYIQIHFYGHASQKAPDL